MKKSLVALLIVLAIIVLISPGIVGRLAEQSMDENLDWAAVQNEDVVITSQGFDRGWFSSEGQHRIEPQTGKFFAVSPDDFGDDRRYVSAVIVDTHIDHGLIPVTSMKREQGSLAPGLGSAISTLSLEIDDSTMVALPGTIYSKVGLTGELQSNLVVEADTAEFEGRFLAWSDADFLFTSNPANGAMAVAGDIDSLSMTSPQETIRIGTVTVDADQQPGPFGFAVGSLDVSMQSVSIQSDNNDIRMGPMTLDSNLDVDGDRVDGSAKFFLYDFESPFGTVEVAWDMRIENADGNALGKVMRAFNAAESQLGAYDSFTGENSVMLELLGAGMELHFDRFDLTLPQGTLTSRLDMAVSETSANNSSLPSILLALAGTLDLKMSPELVEFLTGEFPDFRVAIGLGYLQKKGDEYETYVEIKDGVLTINGAPMQLPLSAIQ